MKKNFYGTGSSFLFKKGENDLAIYGSTMNNNYFLFSDHDGIGMGSDEYYGLFIDNSLCKGSSHGCKTYYNDVLSTDTHFKIKRLEIWGFYEPGE